MAQYYLISDVVLLNNAIQHFNLQVKKIFLIHK